MATSHDYMAHCIACRFNTSHIINHTQIHIHKHIGVTHTHACTHMNATERERANHMHLFTFYCLPQNPLHPGPHHPHNMSHPPQTSKVQVPTIFGGPSHIEYKAFNWLLSIPPWPGYRIFALNFHVCIT